MIRTFIGIFIPENIKEKIIELQESIKKLPLECKLVEKENLHISLSFLGNIEEDKIEEISKTLDEITKNYTKFSCKTGKVVLIPSENYIRVIALDLESNNNILETIRKEIVEKIGGDSYPAHLTLCRVRNVKNKIFVKENLKNISLETYFEVDSLHLVKSQVTRRGPTYLTIHESKLL